MAVVDITIKERIASAPADVLLVCNNPTDTLRFNFDSEWDSQFAKVARFEWDGQFIDVPFSDNEVKVPEITNTLYVNVGVYGDDIASTHVKLQCKRSILCLGNAERVPMDNTNFDQFMAAVNEFNKNSNQMVEATIAANKAASDAAKAAENINVVVEHMPNKANAYKASAAGNPVAFYPDEASLLKSIITLNPVQSGNGDPYMGGAKIPLANWEQGGVSGTNGAEQANSTMIRNVGYITVIPGETYTLTRSGTKSDMMVRAYDADKNFLGTGGVGYTLISGGSVNNPLNASTDTAVITIKNGVHYLRFVDNANDLSNQYWFYKTGGNIRPISARSAIKLTRCGKNLFPYPYASNPQTDYNGLAFSFGDDGSICFSGTATKTSAITLINGSRKFSLPIGRYEMHGTPSGGGSESYRITLRRWKTDGTQIDGWSDMGSGAVFEVTEDVAYIDAYISIAQGINTTGFVFKPIIVPYGDDTTYEPYHGDNYSFDLGQTIYGGSLDWETGVLTADWGYVEFDGTENGWQKGTGNCFIAVDGIAQEISDLVSNQFVNAPTVSVNGLAANQMRQGAVPSNVVFGNPNNMSAAEWKAHLEDMYKDGKPLQLCYKLANPITIQLTTEQMLALDGMNNVYTDSNEDIVTVTYNKSLQKVIEELTNAIISLGGNV